ncbi:FAD-binding protein [Pelagibius litoralis]|uniref:FAD-binding protein n=1 Tax=Pelagibius litoralis TaxID=374515 RepID=A0A967C7N1_9PROT|nr:FAD-dependent oxidoreductase [Pelagibius litoralis]NIA67882.1 FAD-binding protein [Pelagibius litoralis]
MTDAIAQSYDVIVVGYGYAGAVAALAAADAGAEVLLLEKASSPGGISICSAGGLRIASDAKLAFAYLQSTCGGKTPDSVLRAFAEGMTSLADRLHNLARINGAAVEERSSPGNYPLPGAETFGFAYVEAIPGFDPGDSYPHVRGAPQGAMLFKVLEDNVAAKAQQITVSLGSPVGRLTRSKGTVDGVVLADGQAVHARCGVVLACGGFEGSPELQSQYWPGGPALNAAYKHNTGDGIRMAQAAGAALWHMWHYHGSYGYRLPDPAYPYGVRVKRLPDWQPGPDGSTAEDLPLMAWILLDQDGRRFMNEYEPYVQDTGARPLAAFDPGRQGFPRNPAYLITDNAGRSLYPLGKPTRNDPEVQYDWSPDNLDEVVSGLFRPARDIASLAALIGAERQQVEGGIARWNAACDAGSDRDFGRPSSSLHALIEPPFYVAEVHPIVSNTQGGPEHDAQQRVVDPFGQPITGLYAAGECGSLFGHLYMSGGNLAECFIGGEIAGRNAATCGQGENRKWA